MHCHLILSIINVKLLEFCCVQGPPVVLIHGYGASAYHWRYQIPALSQTNRVYAVDLLGFGWSDKALVDYSSGNLWANQLGDFIKEVVAGKLLRTCCCQYRFTILHSAHGTLDTVCSAAVTLLQLCANARVLECAW